MKVYLAGICSEGMAELIRAFELCGFPLISRTQTTIRLLSDLDFPRLAEWCNTHNVVPYTTFADRAQVS